MSLSLSLSLSLWLSSSLSFCWSGHIFSSPWSNVLKVKSLKDCSLKVFSKCICHCLYICLRRCLFVGQVMFVQLLEMISCMIVVIKCARKWSAPPLLYLLSLEIVRTPAEKRTIRLSPKESKIYSFRKASDEFYFIKDHND